jgi:uncharacterized membrane protein YbhN (UPF0104 family)
VQFTRILSQSELRTLSFALRIEYLLPAGVLYLMAHCCWGAFWVRLLRDQGVRVTWFAGLRSYFVSQFGKYIPGKVAVIVIRVAMLGKPGTRLAVGVTATYETLTSMAAGALVGVLCLPYLGVLPAEVSANVVFLFAFAALPVGLGLLHKLAVRMTAKNRGPDARPLHSPSTFLLAQGLLHGAAGWCLLGVSLELVIRGVIPDPPAWDGPAYLGDLAAICLAYVSGFAVLVAPGGLGVREFVLKVMLTPRFAGPVDAAVAEGQAVVVALVLRLTWSVMELCWTLGLWWFGRHHESPPVATGGLEMRE